MGMVREGRPYMQGRFYDIEHPAVSAQHHIDTQILDVLVKDLVFEAGMRCRHGQVHADVFDHEQAVIADLVLLGLVHEVGHEVLENLLV